MIFEFVDNGEVKEIEVDDEFVSTSYINLELLEKEDEDKVEEEREIE